MEVKQDMDIIAQDDILIKLNGHRRNFPGKFTSKTAKIFLVIQKIKADASFTCIIMNKNF